MADIHYNQARLEEIADNFAAADTQGRSIRDGVNKSLEIIQAIWTGSDDVISQRNADFKKIIDSMERICTNLDAIKRYLAEKNTAFHGASTAYKGQ